MTEHASSTPVAIRDLWATPRYVFDAVNAEFNFQLDVAASAHNRLVPAFFCETMNALRQVWPPVPCWCNPPYSNIGPWVEKAIEASRAGATVVMLVPSGTSVAWFKKAWAAAYEIRFISGRLSFISAETGKPVSGNNKGSVILIFRPTPRLSDGPYVSLISRDDML